MGAPKNRKKPLLISFESEPRRLSNGIECWLWPLFLEKLWNNEVI